MSINFKQPRYMVPLILLPFLLIFFYVFHKDKGKGSAIPGQKTGIQGNVGEVSADVRKKSLTDKLDAFRNTYKETDANTAVTAITDEKNNGDREKARLDSISLAMKGK